MTVSGGAASLSLIRQCEALIKSFNPTTHSIDTHLIDALNTDVTHSGAKPADVFKAQVVTGCVREKRVLDGFIKNFYADNAACVLRIDMTMYSVLAYLALFRLRELGFAKFKQLASTEEPSKVSTFVNYLFSKEVLQSSLRSDWMKVVDLNFVERELIGGLERFFPDATVFVGELNSQGARLAEEAEAAEAAKADGTSGASMTKRRNTTRAVSPKLSRPRPPRLPEPERISGQVHAHGVDLEQLNRTTLDKIQHKQQADSAAVHAATLAKYQDPSLLFTFSESKAGRKLDEVKKEIEAKHAAELQFNNTYVHAAPDFSKVPAKIRFNAAAILKEDFLYRKQQAKDAAILKNYEEELRDPLEYFAWQAEMREKDHLIKLENVANRREQAKQSAEEAAAATIKQREDNATVAGLIREQAEVIVKKKELEAEIERIERRRTAIRIAETRDTQPRLAVEKVSTERVAAGQRTREQLEALRLAKEAADRQEEEVRADKIRQLRAVNTVRRAKVSVFDPTKTAGLPLLGEMSYMEMKERLASEKARAEVAELNKRSNIIEAKLKKARELEHRTLTVMHARRVKSEANKAYYSQRRDAEARAKAEAEQKREVAALALEADLRQHRETKKREAEALRSEQERVVRQQQYLGAAAGLVQETLERELLAARERQISERQSRNKQEAERIEAAGKKDRANFWSLRRAQQAEAEAVQREKDQVGEEDARDAVLKIKAEVMRKKALAATSRFQHEVTAKVKAEFNPYAMAITAEGLDKSRRHRARMTSLANTAVSR